MKNFTSKLMACALFSVFFCQKINAQVTVIGGTSATYTSLGAAFAAINAGTHSGAITVDISASITETASAVLNSSGSGTANYNSVSIFPSVDGISISCPAPAGRGVIEINGGDNISLNGDNPNTTGINRNLSIVNTAASTVAYASCVRVATGTGTGFTNSDNVVLSNLILNGNATSRNGSSNTSTTGSENTTFGVVVGPNGGSTVTGIASVSTAMAAGNTANDFAVNNCAINQCARGIAFIGNTSASSSGVTCSNNVIGGAGTLTGIPPYTSPVTTVYTKGIYIQGSNAVTISGNTLQNILSYVSTVMNAIELNSAIGTGLVSVYNNTVTGVVNNVSGNAVNGISIANCAGSYSVTNNILNNVQTLASASSAGISVNTAATSALINGNRISGVFARSSNGYAARGILLGGGSNITVSNNFIWDINAVSNNSASGFTFGVRGINITSGTGHKIYHNTISLSGPMLAGGSSPDVTSCLTIGSTGYTGIEVKNNIFSNTMSGGNGSSNHTCIMLPSGATSAMNLSVNNNAYFGNSSTLVGLAGASVYSISAFIQGATSPASNWRSYTSTLGNVNNDVSSFATTSAAPFVSAIDLHINNASSTLLESTGASIGVANDIDGDVRPGPVGSVNGGAIAPDMGADEFDGIPVLTDIAASAFASPGTTGCFGPNQTVSVVIQNAGLAPINFASNNATVNITATGTNPVTFPAVIISSGTIPVGGIQTVVVSTTYNMSTAGTYSFNGTVNITGDAVASNNTFSQYTATLAPAMPLPESVSFTGYTGANLTTVFPNWYEANGASVPTASTTPWQNQTGLGGASNITARINLYTTTRNEWLVGPKFLATANSALSFDAAVTNYASTTVADVMGSDDKVRVMVSTDCGLTYAPIYTLSAANNLPPTLANFSLSLGAYAGQNIIVAFLASDGPTDDVEDYDFHLDNINLFNVSTLDAGLTAMTAPTSGCFGSAENVVVTINNFGTGAISNVPVSVVVSGAVSQTLTNTYTGTIPVGSSVTFTVGTLNMSTAGTYSFSGSTNLPGDGVFTNDAMPMYTKNVVPVSPLPQQVDFTGFTGANLTTVFPNWYEAYGVSVPSPSATAWTSQTGVGGASNITARINLYTNTRNEWIVGPKFTATSSAKLTFDAAVTNWNSTTASDVMGSDDMVRVMVSTDCGASFTPIYTLSATNNLPPTLTNFNVPLSAYAGQDIIVAFLATDGPIDNAEDYDFHLDNINLFNVPVVDAGVSAMTAPSAGCFGSAENVVVTLNNFGSGSISNVPVSVVISGAVSQTLTNTYSGTIPAGSSVSFTVGVLNMSTAGTYSFAGYSSMPGDGMAINDAMPSYVKNVLPLALLPQMVDFTSYAGTNLNALFPDWNEATGASVPTVANSAWLNQTGVGGATNVTARINLYTNTRNEWILGPKFSATANSQLRFDAAVTDWNSTTAPDVMGADDMVRVMVSTDCGMSYTPIYTLSAANNLPTSLTNFNVSLSAYAGQDIIVAFLATDGPIDNTEDYDFHLDNINIFNMSPTDAGISAMTAPTSGCFGPNENVVIAINNYGTAAISNVPVTVVVSGAVSQTLTNTYTGSIAPGTSASFTIGTLNMSTPGAYNFSGFSSIPGDGNALNDVMPSYIKNVLSLALLPQAVDFTGFTGANLNTVFTDWHEGTGPSSPNNTNSVWLSQTGVGTATNVTARINLFTNTRNEWIVGPKFSVTANTKLSFDVAVTDWNSTVNPDVMGSDDMVRVMVSTNCGLSYAPVFTLSAADNLTTSLTNYSVSLSAYAGQDVIVAFYATDGPVNDLEDYDFHLDNINICDVPVAPQITSAGICSGSSATVSSTVTGTALWYGVPVGGSYISSGVSFTTPALTSNTNYYVADSTACGVGPRASVTVTVNPIPSVTAVSNSSMICVGQAATLTASGASTYTWSSGAIGAATIETPTTTTSYTVTGDANGCAAQFVIVQSVSACTGIESAKTTASNVQVYPNPNNGSFNIVVPGIKGNIVFELYDTMGKLVTSVTLNESLSHINISELAVGIYSYTLKSEGQILDHGKVVRQ